MTNEKPNYTISTSGDNIPQIVEALCKPLPWYKMLYYKLKRGVDAIRYTPKNIKWFLQRGKRGWADCDAWDFFTYNARVVAEVLTAIRIYKIGVPTVLFPRAIKRNPTEKQTQAAEYRWNVILGGMIYAFNMISKDYIYGYDDRKVKRGLRLFTKYYMNLWD